MIGLMTRGQVLLTKHSPGGVAMCRSKKMVESLLDTLESLADQPEEASLRYLLALQLIRRRVLRFAESSSQEETETSDICDREDEVVSLVCRRRDCEYEVVAVMPEAEEHAALEERLASLLWSGGES